MQGRKRCGRCGETKALDEFHNNPRGALGRQGTCKSCMRKRYEADPESYRERNYRRLYGIGIEEYEAMLAAQGGVCAICGSPPVKRRLAVDHDHDTGVIRGVLCLGCNTGIGHLRHSTELLRIAIGYLERTAHGATVLIDPHEKSAHGQQ